ncbi:39336_t:CDS:2 [Gigaspora margarita]|uniref:polynucleotide adenylyltransferase n=1 Tax=Gigaspora margarita TaxID=4874 RepID=A0ABM8W0G4_GIGMA|nr:39336_t:CDS:2 [Gigaspora margarita]
MTKCTKSEILTKQIKDLYQQLVVTEENYLKNKWVVLKINEMLDIKWPNNNIECYLFGSSKTRLAIAKSDIDICVKTKNVGINIYMIKEVLENYNTRLINAYLEISSERVRILVTIIRHWAKQREMSDASNGTLSLYTWTLMILNFLQSRDPPILPVLSVLQLEGDCFTMIPSQEGFKNKKNNESIGELLLKFFYHFSYEFDYNSNVVSLRQGKYLTKKEKNWNNYIGLCVEEPINPERNLGNSLKSESFKKLKNEFCRAYKILDKSVFLKHCCLSYKLNEIYYKCENENLITLKMLKEANICIKNGLIF